MLLERWREHLRKTLTERFEELTGPGGGAPPLPEEFRAAILDALGQQDCDTALLACASAMHCGADGEAGLVPAVSAMMLEAALASHLPVIGLAGGNSVLLDHGEATALLVGDALIPLALENIACSHEAHRHSALMIADAVHALSVRGALERLSLEAEEADEKAQPRASQGSGEIPVTVRECLGRFAAVAGARMAAAPPTDIEEMAKFGLELGRASALPGLNERMCRLFALRPEEVEAEALALVRSAETRISDDSADALARLLLSGVEDSLGELDLLSGAG